MPARGEIWLINFNPSIGAEIMKERPAVVVSADHIGALPLRIVVPLTSSAVASGKPWMVPIRATPQNQLDRDTVADAFQVKSVSVKRFVHLIGKLTPKQMDDIAAAIALSIDYTP
jgi:mRNA interferase MazF